jgi:hypothetical protein
MLKIKNKDNELKRIKRKFDYRKVIKKVSFIIIYK